MESVFLLDLELKLMPLFLLGKERALRLRGMLKTSGCSSVLSWGNVCLLFQLCNAGLQLEWESAANAKAYFGSHSSRTQFQPYPILALAVGKSHGLSVTQSSQDNAARTNSPRVSMFCPRGITRSIM